jgi:hypothetical protein
MFQKMKYKLWNTKTCAQYYIFPKTIDPKEFWKTPPPRFSIRAYLWLLRYLPGLEAVSFDPLIRSLENSGKTHFGVIVDIYLVLNIKHHLSCVRASLWFCCFWHTLGRKIICLKKLKITKFSITGWMLFWHCKFCLEVH